MADATDGSPSDVLVLAYHAISTEWDAVTTVTPGQLREQVEYLIGRGYVGVTFQRALSVPPPGKVLAVTFDDAHRSVYTIAFPLLQELGVTATVFAPTDYVGTGEPTAWDGFVSAAHGPHARELVCLDWHELRTLAGAGWEIGSHTCSHPHLTQLAAASVREELVRSRELLEERLQRPCPSLAYPYSDVNGSVVAAAHAAGYAYGATIPVGSALSLPLRWSRLGVFRSDSSWRFKMLSARATRGFLATTTGTATADALRALKGQVGRLLIA